jgi:hypothetical protein
VDQDAALDADGEWLHGREPAREEVGFVLLVVGSVAGDRELVDIPASARHGSIATLSTVPTTNTGSSL